jgi:hypothetical protein
VKTRTVHGVLERARARTRRRRLRAASAPPSERLYAERIEQALAGLE